MIYQYSDCNRAARLCHHVFLVVGIILFFHIFVLNVYAADSEIICSVYLRSETDLRILEQNSCVIISVQKAALPSRLRTNTALSASMDSLQEALLLTSMDQLEWLAKQQFRPHGVVTLTTEKAKAAMVSGGLSAATAMAILADSDPDADGLTDTEEAWWLCDPNNPDTDNDGVYDGDEVLQLRLGITTNGFPFLLSSINESNDQDRDTIPDLAERGAVGSNSNRESTDGDKYDDGQEYFGTTKYPGWGVYPRPEDGNIGAQMPGYVDDPGRSPFVAAYPEIQIEIKSNTISVQTKEVRFIGHTVGEGFTKTYETSETYGESRTFGSTATHTVNSWQEAGNRQADLEKRASYQDNLSKQQVMTFDSYREGRGIEIEVGSSIETTVGTEASVGIGLLGPSAEVGVYAEVTAGLHSTIKNSLEQESLTENRNFVELQQRSGGSMQFQRINEISSKSGAGQETSMAASVSHTTYHQTTVTEGYAISNTEEWETAKTDDTAHAADLSFVFTIRNTGTDRAKDINNLRFNIKIGMGETDPLITYPDLSKPPISGLNLEPKAGNTYLAGPIPLNLNQLRAIDEEKPVRFWVESFDYGVDQAFYESAWGQSVLFEVDDGVADNTEEVERYMIPTWGDETYQDILKRYFRITEHANGNLNGIRTPEYTADHRRISTWNIHPVDDKSWWDVFVTKLNAAIMSGEPEGSPAVFSVHISNTLTISVNGGEPQTAIFTAITDGAATARQLAFEIESQLSGVRACSLPIGGKNYLRIWSPVTESVRDPTIQVVGGTALPALGFDTQVHDFFTSGRFLHERAEVRSRVSLRYGKDTDGDGYSDREEHRYGTDKNDSNNHPDPIIVAGYAMNRRKWNPESDDTQATITLVMALQNIGNYDATDVQCVLLMPDPIPIQVIDNLCGGSGRLKPSLSCLQIPSDPIVFTAYYPDIEDYIPEVLVSYTSPNGMKKIRSSLNFQFELFKSTKVSSSWQNAKKEAEEMGGQLVVIHNEGQNNAVVSFCRSHPVLSGAGNVWLGASYGGEPKTWTWVDGSPMDYTNWHEGHENKLYLVTWIASPYVRGKWWSQDDSAENYGVVEYVYRNPCWLIENIPSDLSPYAAQMRRGEAVEIGEHSDQWLYNQQNQTTFCVTSYTSPPIQSAKAYYEYATLDGQVVFEESDIMNLSGGGTTLFNTSFQPSSVLPDTAIGKTYKVVCMLTDSQGTIIDSRVKRAVIVDDDIPTPPPTLPPTPPPTDTETPTPSPSPSPTEASPTPTPLQLIDSDGDGFADDFETANGSDPHDPRSVPLKALDMDGDGQLTAKDAIIYYRNRIGVIPVVPLSQK